VCSPEDTLRSKTRKTEPSSARSRSIFALYPSIFALYPGINQPCKPYVYTKGPGTRVAGSISLTRLPYSAWLPATR